MSNSTRVSAALHAELTEYASLLRALRTSHTLDLTNHLTKHANSRGASSDRGAVSTDIEPEDEVEQEASDSPRYLNSETHMATTPVAAPGLETDVSVSISDSRPGKGKKRMRPSETSDMWTRWPLLAGDVHIPEWELGEEVRLIAVQAMQHSSWATKADVSGNHDVDENIQMAGDQSGDELIPDDVDSEALLTPAFLHILSTLTASHLKQILTLLTANTPRVEKSMQDRIAPADWQDVLRAAAGSGSISPEFVSLQSIFAFMFN